MAVYSTFWGLTPIGHLQAGLIASIWGTQTSIFVNGCIVLVYVVAPACFNLVIRALD